MFTDSNSHFHETDNDEATYAEAFKAFLAKLQLDSNTGDEALETMWVSSERAVQDDYIATSCGVDVVPGSQRVAEWAHIPDGRFHEPVVIQAKLVPKPLKTTASRRLPAFDRSKLADPAVQEKIRSDLASIVPPPISVEQTTRAHVVARAVRSVIENAAPPEKKPRKQHWISSL